MKLQLTKSLRTALLACVCGAMVSTTWAETQTLTKGTTTDISAIPTTTTEIVVVDGANLSFGNGGSFTGNVSIEGNGGGGKDGAITIQPGQTGSISGTVTATANAYIYTWHKPDENSMSTLSVGALKVDAGTLTLNNNATWANGTLKVIGDVTGAGSVSVVSGVLEVGGTINVAQKSNLTTNSGTTLTLNNAISNSGAVNLNGNIVVSDALATSLTKTTGSVYSDGSNGFAAQGETYSGLITGSGTVSTSGATVKQGDTVLGSLCSDGLITKVTGDTDYSIYYVNENGYLTTASMNSVAEGGKILVEEGKTLTVASGTCDDLDENVTLSKDSTLYLQNRSAKNNVEITLEGNATIKMQGTSMRADVSGTGNLTLTRVSNEGYVKGNINNTGTVTIDGWVVLHNEGGDVGTIGSEVTSVIVGEGDTLEIYNGQENEFDLNMSGGQILINNNSTMVVAADSTITDGTFTVRKGSTLDLSNVTTLDASELDLNAGSSLVLGEGALTFTGTLKVQDGAIIDLSSWDTDVYEFWYEELFKGGTTLEFVANADGTDGTGLVYIDFGDGSGLWKNWLITDEANPGSVYAIPEPATATLSLLALAGLAARRRRK